MEHKGTTMQSMLSMLSMLSENKFIESLEPVSFESYNPTHCQHCNSTKIIRQVIQTRHIDYVGIYHVVCLRCNSDIYLSLV
jgi:superfamily II helicase